MNRSHLCLLLVVAFACGAIVPARADTEFRSYDDIAAAYLDARDKYAPLFPPLLPLPVEKLAEMSLAGDWSFTENPEWFHVRPDGPFPFRARSRDFRSYANDTLLLVFEDVASGRIVVLDEWAKPLAVYDAPPWPFLPTLDTRGGPRAWELEFMRRRLAWWVFLDNTPPAADPPPMMMMGQGEPDPDAIRFTAISDVNVQPLEMTLRLEYGSNRVGETWAVFSADWYPASGWPTEFDPLRWMQVSDELVLGADTNEIVWTDTGGYGQAPWTDILLRVYALGSLEDSDGDGIPNWWEGFMGSLYDFPDEWWDYDGDGLALEEEYWLGTDPLNPDTDGDGMPDGWEVMHCLDPLRDDADEDPDADGHTNLQEYEAEPVPTHPKRFPGYEERVSLAGSFNGWNTGATPMTMTTNYVWTHYLEFEPDATNTFKFVSDGHKDGWENFTWHAGVPPPAPVFTGGIASEPLMKGTEAANIDFYTATGGLYRIDINTTSVTFSVTAVAEIPATFGELCVCYRLVGSFNGWAHEGDSFLMFPTPRPDQPDRHQRFVWLSGAEHKFKFFQDGSMLKNWGQTNQVEKVPPFVEDGVFGTASQDLEVDASGQPGLYRFVLWPEAEQFAVEFVETDRDGDGLLDLWDLTVNSNDYRYAAMAAAGLVYFDEENGDRTFKGELTVGTLPLNPDTSGDGLSDGEAVRLGFDPTVSNTVPAAVWIRYPEDGELLP